MKKIILAFAVIVILISGCKKDDNNNNNNTTATCSDGIQNQGETGVDCGGPCSACITSGYFLTGSLSGVTTSASGSNAALPHSSDPWGASGENRVVYAGGVWYSPSFSLKGEVTMHKNFLNHLSTFTNSEIYTVYAPGAYGYSTNTLNSEGAEIIIEDAGGTSWYSQKGDNTGSTFTITARGAYSASGFSTTYEGSFSCKVYDTGGNMKTFAGTFRSLAGY